VMSFCSISRLGLRIKASEKLLHRASYPVNLFQFCPDLRSQVPSQLGVESYHAAGVLDPRGLAIRRPPTPVQVSVSPEVAVAPVQRRRQPLTAFRLTEQQMTILTGALAVGSGFYTLYFVGALWGTPKDYLYAFLWGSVVSGGLKLVSNLAKGVWPAS
jgi:hypothetical protein